MPPSRCQTCCHYYAMPPSRCTLPDVKLAATTTRCILPDAKLAVTTLWCQLPDAKLLPPLPDATSHPQIDITRWPFASSRWPFHDNQRTKTSILCSKCPKTRVLNPKSAQKPRFCARNVWKQGFPTPKAHKNLDFVLGKRVIGTKERGN